MALVKTFGESKETEGYLRFNGYKKAVNLFGTQYYLCMRKGFKLDDVKVIF